MKTVLAALALSAWAFPLAAAAPAQLLHTPVMSGSAGQDLEIQATLLGAGPAAKVRLYYRPHGKEIFRSLEMQGGAGSLAGTIPGEAVQSGGLEYYIEAANYGGAKTVLATYPANNPALAPVQVVVHQDATPPDMLVLNPTDGSMVDTSDPVLSVAVNDDDSGIDPSSVTVLLDGKALPSPDNGEVNPYTLQLKDLKDGAHSVIFRSKDKAGNVSRLTWSFTVAATSASKAAGIKAWVADGHVGYETAYGLPLPAPKSATNGLPYQPYGLNRGDLDVHLRNDSQTLGLRVHVTDEERKESQPVDRFTGTWSNREGVVTVGDVNNATFTELTLYQLPELRGFEADLRSGDLKDTHSRFIGLWGQTERPIEAGATGFNGVSSTATFGQYLYGARWEGGGPHFQTGWSAVSINDDLSSLKNPGSQQPSYNTMLSTDWRIASPEIHLALTAEGAVDYYAAAADPTGFSAGGSYRAGALWDMLPWGTRASFEWRDLGGTLSNLTTKFGGPGIPIPGGYSSMGNPGLISDYRGFESGFSQHLFDGQLGVDLSYNNWRDNLNDTKTGTTVTKFLSGALNIAPFHWPSLTLGASENETQGYAYSYGALSSHLLNTSYNVSLGYTVVKQDAAQADGQQGYSTWSYNANWSITNLRDLESLRSAQDLTAWNVVAVVYYSHLANSLNLNAGLGQSNSPAGALSVMTSISYTPGILVVPTDLPTQAVNNLNIGAHWAHQWKGTAMDSNLGWDYSSTSSNTDAAPSLTAAKIDSLRNTASCTGGYKLAKAQKLSLQVAYAMIDASTDNGSGAVTDNYGELYTDLRYDLNF